LDAISSAAASYDALTLVDATQACGWLPLDAGRFSVVATGGYKWLCHPRGTAFMTIAPELRDRIVPRAAGWYVGEHPWDTCYGTPLRLASDARRFDVSPAWLSWHAAAATLELFEAVGLGRIHEHNLALANRLRTGLGLEPGDSAIVSLDAASEATERLAGAGVEAAVRANRVRLSCHLYNDEEDVDRTLEVLTDSIHAGRWVILSTLPDSSRVVAHEPAKIIEASIGRNAPQSCIRVATSISSPPTSALPCAELESVSVPMSAGRRRTAAETPFPRLGGRAAGSARYASRHESESGRETNIGLDPGPGRGEGACARRSLAPRLSGAGCWGSGTRCPGSFG
jgi:Aminotransferase class-V